MKCPTCEKAGLKSCVFGGESGMSTCMGYSLGYYNEEGKYIRLPDPNITTYNFRCSNDHEFSVSYKESEEPKVTVYKWQSKQSP